MSSYDQATSVRQRVTLSLIIGRLHDLVEQENNNARMSESMADEVCGSEPDAATVSPPLAPVSGRLDGILQMLDTLGRHQSRVAYSGQRLAGSLSDGSGKEALASVGSQVLGRDAGQGRY